MTPQINTVELIGKTEEDVVAQLKNSGFVTRVLSRNGQVYAGTGDYRLDRYSLSLNHGKVTNLKLG